MLLLESLERAFLISGAWDVTSFPSSWKFLGSCSNPGGPVWVFSLPSIFFSLDTNASQNLCPFVFQLCFSGSLSNLLPSFFSAWPSCPS